MCLEGVLEELLWFIKGSNAKELSPEVKIGCQWNPETLDSLFPPEERTWDQFMASSGYFRAEYRFAESDYSGQGVDQLQRVIDTSNQP